MIVHEASRLFSYDKLLFSVPMWNWSIPFVLKRFIDVVTQPGVLFEWSPAMGYVGLLKKPVAIIYSSSFAYPAERRVRKPWCRQPVTPRANRPGIWPSTSDGVQPFKRFL